MHPHIIRDKNMGPVTKTENIKTDATKILRPTHFSGSKNIKTDSFLVGLNLSKKTENKTENINRY